LALGVCTFDGQMWYSRDTAKLPHGQSEIATAVVPTEGSFITWVR